jgi:hypothetical protein
MAGWICRRCGTTHIVTAEQIGKRMLCRSCEGSGIVADNVDDEKLSAWATGKQLELKRKPPAE